MAGDALSREAIALLLKDIRQRVEAQNGAEGSGVSQDGGFGSSIPLPDLLEIVHLRDSAQAKVASIGSVNPRPGGFKNNAVQFVKRGIARLLAWFVRDQITFNRQILASVDALLEGLTTQNRALSMLASQTGPLNQAAQRQLEFQTHWREWHAHWELNLETTELRLARSLAELQSGYFHRVTLLENSFRELVRSQHREFASNLDQRGLEIQNRLWADMQKIRGEYEHLIFSELRVLRQRMLSRAPDASSQVSISTEHRRSDTHDDLGFDYARFAERFRGSESYVQGQQEFYVPFLQNVGSVLDVGCGRGEFLKALRNRDIPARGIEASDECVQYCVSQGLPVEKADLFDFLEKLPDRSEDAIFCSQVVEHLEPRAIPRMIGLCASKLRTRGLLIVETPNPECLAIFASHFYLDPTHTRPVPSSLLSFYLEEAGFGQIEVYQRSPAQENFPEIQLLPEPFASRFFGGLDYAAIARKL